jgi:hypothetical protein
MYRINLEEAVAFNNFGFEIDLYAKDLPNLDEVIEMIMDDGDLNIFKEIFTIEYFEYWGNMKVNGKEFEYNSQNTINIEKAMIEDLIDIYTNKQAHLSIW